LKHPEDGAREGAKFINDHIIRVTERAFDDFTSIAIRIEDEAIKSKKITGVLQIGNVDLMLEGIEGPPGRPGEPGLAGARLSERRVKVLGR